jgi:group I intron endonuclease
MQKGRHNNHFIQNHYNKYGWDDFVFSIVEVCTLENLKEREQYYIDTEVNGARFNLDKKVDNHIMGCKKGGHKLTLEHRRQLSIANKGRPSWNKGKHIVNGGTFKKGFTPWNKNKHHSEEHKRALREAWELRRVNHPITEETREKFRRQIGNKNPFWGKHHSKETIEKIKIGKARTRLLREQNKNVA